MITRTQANLLSLIGPGFKKVAGTNGGEYHGPCPFCGGTDRCVVQPNDGDGGHYWCRQCGKTGDAITLLRERDGLSFQDACAALNVVPPERPGFHTPQFLKPSVSASDLKDYPCFEADWQRQARSFADACHQRLIDGWYIDAYRAAHYLEGRGIDRQTARANWLGLNLTELRACWGNVNVWLPRGITIPWSIDRQLWNLRVRRPNADLKSPKDDKYISPAGSTAFAMYRIDRFLPGDIVIMTEGEFDAILLGHYFLLNSNFNVVVVSIGSNTGARLLRWVSTLSLASVVYLAFDNDDAGDQAAQYWLAALPKLARRLRPSKKDITDMWQAGELTGFVGGIEL